MTDNKSSALSKWTLATMLWIGFMTSHGEGLTAGADWPSFRGGVHPGMAAQGDYPTHWDLDSGQNVGWKAAIPGLGHSSPAIHGNCVIVTTAYTGAGRASSMRPLEVVSTVARVLFAAVLGLCVAADVMSIVRKTRGSAFYWVRGFFVCAAGLLLLMMLQTGAEVFAYQRCPIRSWLGTHLAATLGPAVALSLTIGRPWTRRFNTTILVLLALSILFLIPAKDHVFRQGILGPQSIVVLGSGAVPLTLAAAMFAAYAWLYREEPGAGLRRYRYLYGLLIAILALTLCVLRVAHTSHVDYLATADLPNSFFSPMVVFRLIVFSFMGLVTSAVSYRIIRRGFLISALVGNQMAQLIKSGLLAVSVVAAAGLLMGVLAVALNSLILQSTFLQYHLPTPNWNSLNGFPFLINAAVFLGVLIATVLVSQPVPIKTASLGAAMTVLTTIAWLLHVVAANAEHQEQHFIRAVVALDRQDGSLKWIWEGLATPRDVVHRENSQATPSPVAAGNRVVAYFGSAGLVCLDASSGKQLWSRTDVSYESIYGAGASPVVEKGVVVVVSDAPKSAWIVALDVESGRTVWQHDRSDLMYGMYADSGHSHTPLVLDLKGCSVVFVPGWDKLVGYDLETGDIVSQCNLIGGGDRVASAASDEQRVYFGNPRELVAFSKVSLQTKNVDCAWRTRSDSNCVSPVSDGECVYTCSDQGIVYCIDAATGKMIWRSRLRGEFRSSPIIAGRHLYLGSLDGTLHLLNLDDPHHEWKQLEFQHPIFATPAAVNSQLFVRTESFLYLLSQSTPDAGGD